MKKIVIVGPAYPLRGGIANLNEALAAELMQSGHSVHIASFSLQYPNFLFPGKTQFDEAGIAPKGLYIQTFINSINPLNWLSSAFKIMKHKPDLVIVRYWLPFMAPCLGTINWIIRLFSKARIVGITDNVIPHEKRFGDKIFTSYFVSSAHAFLTMSKTVERELKEFTTQKPTGFSPHPVYNIFGEAVSKSSARERLKLSSNDKVILFFGFIRKYKGLQLLLEAMCDDRIKQLGVKLLVAGEFYELEEETKQFIATHQLADRVVLHHEFISNEEVKQYFCAADAVVQPYITASQSGITQIAYQFGTPMIVTNVGGLSEIVKHETAGYVVEPNALALANGILDFYQLHKEERFRQGVKQEAEKYSWNYFVDALLKLGDI
jgi:glycosyltransferase involved in cell wall biosynthesis